MGIKLISQMASESSFLLRMHYSHAILHLRIFDKTTASELNFLLRMHYSHAILHLRIFDKTKTSDLNFLLRMHAVIIAVTRPKQGNKMKPTDSSKQSVREENKRQLTTSQ